MWTNIGFKAQLLVRYIRVKKHIIRFLELLFLIPSKKHYIVFYHDSQKEQFKKSLKDCVAKNERHERYRNQIIINRLISFIYLLSCVFIILVIYFIKGL